MVIIATLLVALAAVLHLAIFAMESIGWTRPAIWKRFNVADQAQADANRQLAYNQGFYNLFLAIGAIVGIVLVGVGQSTAGFALIFLALGSMVAAAIVLTTLGKAFVGPALTQGILPAIALLLSVIAATTA